MQVYYGAKQTFRNVTRQALDHFLTDCRLEFPESDEGRARVFGDPCFGIVKEIRIMDQDDSMIILPAGQTLTLSITQPIQDQIDTPRGWWNRHAASIANPDERLQALHAHIQLNHGGMDEEYCEQKMAVRYIKPDATVLELGGNIGRNTVVISTILSNPERHVVCESDANIARQLQENCTRNHLTTVVLPVALSKRKLIQRGWDTIPSEFVLPGYTEVKTMSYETICQTYSLRFDTIVADCEGALYYILQDEPTLLEGIHTVLLENDFPDRQQKDAVDAKLKAYGFECVYTDTIDHYMVRTKFSHSKDCFYQVWTRAV